MHGRIVIALLCLHFAACGKSYPSIGERSTALTPRLCGTGECTATVLASAQPFPIAIQVKEDTVFWGNYGDFDWDSEDAGSEGAIMAMPRNGGDVTRIKDGIVGLTGIAVHGRDVYWTATGKEVLRWQSTNPDGEVGVASMPVPGIRPNRFGPIASSVPLIDALGPSIAGGNLYFADFNLGAIMGVRLLAARNEGGYAAQNARHLVEAQVFASGQDGPCDTAADGTHVAWVNNTSGEVVVAKRGGQPEVAADGQSNALTAPYAVALKDNYVSWVRNSYPGDPGYLLRTEKEMPRGGSRTVTLLGTAPTQSAVSLAVDGTDVYWTTIDESGYDGQLLRTPVGGGETVPLLRGLAMPYAVDFDENAVYIAEGGYVAGEGNILRFEKRLPPRR